MPTKLLEGIKVVDFGWSLVGPLISKDFADWGAEVIRIESGTRVGLFRTLGHFKDDIEGYNRNGIFNQVNTNILFKMPGIKAQLEISKSVSSIMLGGVAIFKAVPGATVTYIISYSNASTAAAADGVINDAVSAEAKYFTFANILT